MRRVVVGLVLGVLLGASVPSSAQSPAPSDLPSPCPASAPAVLFAPAVIGLTPEQADAMANPAGVTVLYLEVEAADAAPGTIVVQDPAPGALLDGNQVTASVAVAPAATPEPTKKPKPTKKPVDLTKIPFARLKSMAKEPNYKSFFRNAEAFEGKLVAFTGQVFHFVPGENGEPSAVLVNVTKDRFGFWSDTVWLIYDGKRLIPQDMVSFVGRALPPYTYETAGGASNTVPLVDVIQLRRTN